MDHLATGWFVDLIQQQIGDFVEVDHEMFSSNIWNGDVSLSGLALKPSALDSLNLPITVKAGTLGSLHIHLPWTKLGYEPIIVDISDIHLVANLNVWNRNAQDEANFAAKMDDLRSRMEPVLQKAMMEAREDKGKAAPTWGSALMENMFDNLQVTIKNIHIRFEDDTQVHSSFISSSYMPCFVA